MTHPLTRREAFQVGVAGLVAPAAGKADDPPERRFLTPAKDFQDVSRGKPVPHSLKGEALIKARLTPPTWRLEVNGADRAHVEKAVTLDFDGLQALGKKHAVRFLKAMQCNNIARPLGQGLWEGVPLREVLRLCGGMDNMRRVYYWGFHNDDPRQMFRSSLAINQVLDAPPGELPPFVAYKLNGGPIPLERGGPVRMVVPWAHGFKSIKWLQHVVVSNDYKTNDTYAEANNDPESYLKTAAYFDAPGPQTLAADRKTLIRGTCMVGWPGLKRVEYWLRVDPGTKGKLADDDPAWAMAVWKEAIIDPPPADWGGGLPDGVLPKDVWGFDERGRPKEWPLRYSIAHWSLNLPGLKAGDYELRVRTVDANGFAQPEPRPYQKSGRNLVQCKLLKVK
jgi:DMSO/TMAO reductase YedYZ molybdopterin-dependent catalytic subunit